MTVQDEGLDFQPRMGRATVTSVPVPVLTPTPIVADSLSENGAGAKAPAPDSLLTVSNPISGEESLDVDRLIAEGIPLTLKLGTQEAQVRVRYSSRAVRELERRFGSIGNAGIALEKLKHFEDDADITAALEQFPTVTDDARDLLKSILLRYKGSNDSDYPRMDMLLKLLSVGLGWMQNDNGKVVETPFLDPEYLIDWIEFHKIGLYIGVVEAGLILAMPRLRGPVQNTDPRALAALNGGGPGVSFTEPPASTLE